MFAVKTSNALLDTGNIRKEKMALLENLSIQVRTIPKHWNGAVQVLVKRRIVTYRTDFVQICQNTDKKY